MALPGWKPGNGRGRVHCQPPFAPLLGEQDEREAALQANVHHGLPSSASNRSASASWLFTRHPEMTQLEIAQRVGIKPSTVKIAIKRRAGEQQASEERSRQRTALLWQKGTEEEKVIADAKEAAAGEGCARVSRSVQAPL